MGYDRETMTVHGFRSMASTLLNEQGVNGDWIERQLAHGERNSVRAAYNYAEHLPERKVMMQWWSDFLDGLRDGQAVPEWRDYWVDYCEDKKNMRGNHLKVVKVGNV